MKMRKVKFSVSTGFAGSEIEEEFTLEELGIDEDEYESEEELNKDINEAYEEWMRGAIDAYWDFIE